MDLQKWLKNALLGGIFRFLPLAILASLADAALLWGIRSFMEILNHEAPFSLTEWIILMVALTTARALFLFLKTKSSETTLFRINEKIQVWFLRHLRDLSPRLFHQKEGDNLVESAYESTVVLQNNGNVFFQAIQAILQLAIFLPVLIFISWQLTLFLFVIIVPLVAWLQRKIHALGPEEEDILNARSQLRSDLNSARKLYRNWSALHERAAVSQDLRNSVKEISSKSRESSIRKNALSLTTESVSVLAMILILSFCVILISRGWMDGTGLVLFCSAVLLSYKPVKECAKVIPQFRSACSAYKILKNFSKLPTKKTIPQNHCDEFHVEQGSFRYEGSDIPVYSGFNLKLDRSRPVLLRGANGIGKSTLLRLLAGLEEWQVSDSRNSSSNGGIFFIAQDLELPPRQLLNSLLDKQDSSLAHFIDIAKATKLLGKQGLSGGERARVALVWALASHESILLLDEPFAAVALADREILLQEFLKVAEAHHQWVIVASHDSIGEDLMNKFNIVDLNHG